MQQGPVCDHSRNELESRGVAVLARLVDVAVRFAIAPTLELRRWHNFVAYFVFREIAGGGFRAAARYGWNVRFAC